MKITYSKKIKKTFGDITQLKKMVGLSLTKQIIKRINQLSAMDNINTLINSGIDHPHFLEGDLKLCIGWSLTGNIRLILDCNINEVNSIIEAKKLEEVLIKGVVDYHDGKYEWIIH